MRKVVVITHKMEQPKRIDAHIDSDDDDLGRDWLKIDRNVKNDGFRIGLESSQEQSLQAGFNAGFREAMQMALAGGKLQGGICASLSYANSDIAKVMSSLSSVEVKPQSINVQSGPALIPSPLQSLISSNSDLISSIPGLLQHNLIKSMSVQSKEKSSHPDCSNSSSSLCCSKKATELEYLEIFPAESLGCTAVDAFLENSERKASQGDEQKQASSCEHVCNSKSHFWNQLEHFKMQAQSLEVISSHD